MKKVKKIFLIFIAIIATIVLLSWYSNYKFSDYKTNTVTQLEQYKAGHSKYPENLNVLEIGNQYDLNYYTDSLQQSYRLTYTSGIMDCNLNEYTSQTKQWRQEFSY